MVIWKLTLALATTPRNYVYGKQLLLTFPDQKKWNMKSRDIPNNGMIASQIFIDNHTHLKGYEFLYHLHY